MTGLRFTPELDAAVTTLTSLGDAAPDTSSSTYAVLDGLRRDGLAPTGPWPVLDDAAFSRAIARVYRMGRGLGAVECAEAQSRDTTATVLPLTAEPIELHVIDEASDGERTSRHALRWLNDPDRRAPHAVVIAGVDQAHAAPGVLDAIRTADVVVLPPMLPTLDAAAFLALSEVRDALRGTSSRVVAFSPIGLDGGHEPEVAEAAWRIAGVDPTSASLARLYADFVDVLVIDDAEAPGRYPSSLTVTRAPLAAAMSGDREAVEALRAVVLT